MVFCKCYFSQIVLQHRLDIRPSIHYNESIQRCCRPGSFDLKISTRRIKLEFYWKLLKPVTHEPNKAGDLINHLYCQCIRNGKRTSWSKYVNHRVEYDQNKHGWKHIDILNEKKFSKKYGCVVFAQFLTLGRFYFFFLRISYCLIKHVLNVPLKNRLNEQKT